MTEEQIIKAFEEMAEDNRMPIINVYVVMFSTSSTAKRQKLRD